MAENPAACSGSWPKQARDFGEAQASARQLYHLAPVVLKIDAWQLSSFSASGCSARLLVESCSSARRLALAFGGHSVCVCHLDLYFSGSGFRI
jgi:hypothetical protein